MANSTTQPPSDRERIYRRNFPFFLLDNILFSLAYSIISPSTVIPDFIRRLTRSEILIGLSSSLFDVGWTLPQLFVARLIVRHERKKWWFIGPNIPVRFVILAFSGLIMLLGKDRPGAILAAFFICYAIAAVGDGIVGVPWAVLAGTSLDSRWRARVFGLSSGIVAVIMLGGARLIGMVLGDERLPFPNNYALIFGAAGVIFALSILPMIFIRELPSGKTVEKTPSMAEFLPSLGHVLRSDSAFRSMVIARLLTSLFVMGNPFYIGFATVKLGLSSTVAVPTLLAMQTIGSVSGSLIYTWLGARNNLMYIRLALGVSAFLPLSALLAAHIGPAPLYVGFLISGLTVNNLLMSYQNWVITHSSPEQRPAYTGLFNTISALVALISPLIGGSIAQHLGYEALFCVALAMALCALFVTLRFVHSSLPEAALTADGAR